MSRLTRDGTAEPVSRDQILRHARGQGNIIFSVQLTTSRIGNLTRLIHTLLYVMTIHTYIHTISTYCIRVDGTIPVYYYKPILLCTRPGSSEVPRNPLTRWDESSIPANGIFLTKKIKTKIKLPNGWRTIESLVHKIRLHGRRGKRMAESFSREKLRHAPQKAGG